MSVIPALSMLGQEYHKFQVSLEYRIDPVSRNKSKLGMAWF